MAELNWHRVKSIAVLNGKKINSIEGLEKESEEVIFHCEGGFKLKMYHIQDCCENVELEDISGPLDMADAPYFGLEGATVISAEERINDGDTEWGTQTWTFYDIQTDKGFINLRWLGKSNGYYSEAVDLEVCGGEFDLLS